MFVKVVSARGESPLREVSLTAGSFNPKKELLTMTNNTASWVEAIITRPETFRLPKPGQRDPYFGLPRTTYYELEKAGTIRLIRLRKRGNIRGTTLIPFDQVLAYLRGLSAEGK